MKYEQSNATQFMIQRYGRPKYNIFGTLHKTNKKVKPVRCGERAIHVDDANQEWVAYFRKWWKFPEEIEY